MSKSIVKDSSKLRNALKSRWKELGLSQQDIENDAKAHGKDIIRQAINKYINNGYSKGALNEEKILWLAWRWLVPVTLSVGIPDNTGVRYEIPEYNEEKALAMLNKVFPK